MVSRQPEAWSYRAVNDEWRWNLTEHLQAAMVDALNLLVWSKTEDAAKGRGVPKPVPRPHAGEVKKPTGAGGVQVADDFDPAAIDYALSLPRVPVEG